MGRRGERGAPGEEQGAGPAWEGECMPGMRARVWHAVRVLAVGTFYRRGGKEEEKKFMRRQFFFGVHAREDGPHSGSLRAKKKGTRKGFYSEKAETRKRKPLGAQTVRAIQLDVQV